MKLNCLGLILLFVTVTFTTISCEDKVEYKDPNVSVGERVADLMKRMTIEAFSYTHLDVYKRQEK